MDVKQKIKELLKKGGENGKLERYHEALALFEEARVMSSSLSVEDPLQSEVLVELGICYTFDGQFSEGEKYLRESLALRQQMHQNVGAITLSLFALGDCLRRQHKLSDAEDVLKQALEQEQNPNTAMALYYMGWCLSKQKKWKQAQSHCEQCIAMYRTRPLDDFAVHAISMLGVCRYVQGHHTEGVTSVRSAVEVAMKVEGPDGIQVANCLWQLSVLLNASGRYEECEAEVQEALRIVRHHSLPHTHSLRVGVVRMLRECLTKQGKGEGAATVDADIPDVCQPSDSSVLDMLLMFEADFDVAVTEGRVAIPRLKVDVIGGDDSGKSSFIDALLVKVFADRESTVGMKPSLAITSSCGWKDSKRLDVDHYLHNAMAVATVAVGEESRGEGSRQEMASGLQAASVASGVSVSRAHAVDMSRYEKRKKATGTTIAELIAKYKENNDLLQEMGGILLRLCDYAGQRIFNCAHRCLWAPHGPFDISVVCIVFDLSKPLDSPSLSYFRSSTDDHVMEMRVSGECERYVDYVRYCLMSVRLSYAERRQGSSLYMGANEGVAYPAVLFVATHASQVKDQQFLTRQNEILENVVNECGYVEHIVKPKDDSGLSFFAVENSTSGSKKEDSKLPVIRRLLEGMANWYWDKQEKQPMSWYMVEKVTEEMHEETGSAISDVSDIKQIAREVCGVSEVEDMEQCMCYLSSLGVHLHYPKSRSLSLRQKVFTDATWLMDAMGMFFTPADPPPRLQQDYRTLTHKGLMSRRLAEYRLDKAKVPAKDHQTLLDLFKEFDLAVSVPSQWNDQLFVPSQLEESFDRPKAKDLLFNNQGVPPLVLLAEDVDMWPDSLFFQLVVRLIDHFPEYPSLKRNRCVFHILDDVEMEMYHEGGYVTVSVWSVAEEGVMDGLRSWCPRLRVLVIEELTKAVEQSARGFQYEVCFHPPSAGDRLQRDALASLETYKPWGPIVCNKKGQRISRMECRRLNIWFDDQTQRQMVLPGEMPRDQVVHPHDTEDTDVSVADLLVRDLPCDVKEDVYDHLDVTDTSGGDWCHLAKEFGLSEQAVKKIRELYKERSEQVIQRWERENGCKMRVNFLMDALRRMSECHPALNLLEGYMASTHSSTQETDTSDVPVDLRQPTLVHAADTDDALCSGALRLTAAADSKVTAKVQEHVARLVAGMWEHFAIHLYPRSFTATRTISVIKRKHRTPFLQALAMLKKWSGHFRKRATCRALIVPLCAMECRAMAVEVFGLEMVDSVSPHQQQVSIPIASIEKEAQAAGMSDIGGEASSDKCDVVPVSRKRRKQPVRATRHEQRGGSSHPPKCHRERSLRAGHDCSSDAEDTEVPALVPQNDNWPVRSTRRRQSAGSEPSKTCHGLERCMASVKNKAQPAGRARGASQQECEVNPVMVQIPKRQGRKRPVSAARRQQSSVSANPSKCLRSRSLQFGCDHSLSFEETKQMACVSQSQKQSFRSTRHRQCGVSSPPVKSCKGRRMTSGLDHHVSIAERRKVAQQIAGEWEKVARHLEPEPLDMDKIIAIQRTDRDREEQAQLLLYKWCQSYGSEATQYHLIKALLGAEKKAIAENVFGGLVSVVEEEVGGNSVRAVRTRACCPPRVDKPPPRETVNIVCRVGCSSWRQIGRGLGYSHSEIKNIDSADPTWPDSEKLHKVVNQWMMKYGSCATLQRLVEVCQSEEVAVYGAVDMEIRRLYGTSLKL